MNNNTHNNLIQSLNNLLVQYNNNINYSLRIYNNLINITNNDTNNISSNNLPNNPINNTTPSIPNRNNGNINLTNNPVRLTNRLSHRVPSANGQHIFTRVMHVPNNQPPNNTFANSPLFHNTNLLRQEMNNLFTNNNLTNESLFSELNNISRRLTQDNFNFFNNLFQPNNTQQLQTLTPQLLQQLTTTFTFDSSNNNLNDTICPISLAPFQNGDLLIRINHCNHVFLKDNILQWFQRNNRCPVCRYNLLSNTSNNNQNSDVSNNQNETEQSNIIEQQENLDEVNMETSDNSNNSEDSEENTFMDALNNVFTNISSNIVRDLSNNNFTVDSSNIDIAMFVM